MSMQRIVVLGELSEIFSCYYCLLFYYSYMIIGVFIKKIILSYYIIAKNNAKFLHITFVLYTNYYNLHFLKSVISLHGLF